MPALLCWSLKYQAKCFESPNAANCTVLFFTWDSWILNTDLILCCCSHTPKVDLASNLRLQILAPTLGIESAWGEISSSSLVFVDRVSWYHFNSAWLKVRSWIEELTRFAYIFHPCMFYPIKSINHFCYRLSYFCGQVHTATDMLWKTPW